MGGTHLLRYMEHLGLQFPDYHALAYSCTSWPYQSLHMPGLDDPELVGSFGPQHWSQAWCLLGPLKRRRLPQKTAGGPCFCGTACASQPGSGGAYSPRQGPGVAGSFRHEKPRAPAAKARPPPPAGKLNAASDATFDAAARERRWRRPGYSGKAEPPKP